MYSKILLDNFFEIGDWINTLKKTEIISRKPNEKKTLRKMIKSTFQKQKKTQSEKYSTCAKSKNNFIIDMFNVYRIITIPTTTYFLNLYRSCIRFSETVLILNTQSSGGLKKDFIFTYRQIKQIGISDNVFAIEVDAKLDIPEFIDQKTITFYLTVDSEANLKSQFLIYAKKQFMDTNAIDGLNSIFSNKNDSTQTIVNKTIDIAGVLGEFQFITNPAYSPLPPEDEIARPRHLHVKVSIEKHTSSVTKRVSMENNSKSVKRCLSRCQLSMDVETFEKYIYEKKAKNKLKKQSAMSSSNLFLILVDETKTVREITEFYETLVQSETSSTRNSKFSNHKRARSGIVKSLSGDSEVIKRSKTESLPRRMKYKTL